MSWISRLFSAPSASPKGKLSSRRRETRSRITLRELLYKVVREALVGMGLLSSQFKFKVLTVDSDGLQFVVMVDLSDQVQHELGRLTDLENHIVQRALSQHDMRVKAVYWRLTDRDLVKRPTDKPKVASKSLRPIAAQRLGQTVPGELGADPVADPANATASGFALTEWPDGGLPNKPLSSTQYGDL